MPSKIQDINNQEEEEMKLFKQKQRVMNIIEKVENKFFERQKEVDGRSIIEVTNKVLSLDKSKNQKEIYDGRYTLNINQKMPQEIQIQRFAGEKIAFYLHKKRDFLMRLENHSKGKKNS